MSPGQLVRPGQCRPPRGPTVGLEVVPLPLDLTPSGTTSRPPLGQGTGSVHGSQLTPARISSRRRAADPVK